MSSVATSIALITAAQAANIVPARQNVAVVKRDYFFFSENELALFNIPSEKIWCHDGGFMVTPTFSVYGKGNLCKANFEAEQDAINWASLLDFAGLKVRINRGYILDGAAPDGSRDGKPIFYVIWGENVRYPQTFLTQNDREAAAAMLRKMEKHDEYLYRQNVEEEHPYDVEV